MSDVPFTVNLDCKICGAVKTVVVPTKEEATAEMKKWLELHRVSCSKGRDGEVVLSGQEDEASPVMPLGVFKVKNR
jgi:hypothetical protein